MKWLTLAGALVLAISCLSCGGYATGSAGSTSTTSIAGTWQFTYVSSHGGMVTVTGPLAQNGSTISGSATITGSCGASGNFSGTLNGTTFTGTLTENTPETITFTGSVATSYSSSNGTYQVTSATGACASAMGDSGTWTASRTAAPSGGYGGMIRPADRAPIGIALSLNSDGGQISGTATFTNSACLHSAQVTGSVSGLSMELHADGANASVTLNGTMDSAAKTLQLQSSVSGMCSAESGSATLTKVE